MDCIVITKNGEGIEVKFNCYYRNSGSPYASPEVNSEVSTYPWKNIDEIWKDGEAVFVRMGNRREWRLGITQGLDNFVIDSVNGVAPTDASHLYDLIKSLIP